MPEQTHRLLLSALGIHVHVYRSVDALIDDDHREFTVDAAREDAPQECIFRSVILRIVDGEMAESGAVKHNALNLSLIHI